LPLIIFYSGIENISCIQCEYIFIFTHGIMNGVIAYIELLVLYELYDFPCFGFCLCACVGFLFLIAHIFFVIGLWALV
jgi:hypothetical protein